MSLASRSALESRLTGLATEFDERQGATRIDLRDNLIVDNNGYSESLREWTVLPFLGNGRWASPRSQQEGYRMASR